MDLEGLFIISLTLISILATLVLLFWDLFHVHGFFGMWSKVFDWQERLRINLKINEHIWKKLTDQEIEIIKDIYFTAKSNDVKFITTNDQKIEYPSNNKTMVSGYFNGDEMDSEPTFGLAVGGKKEDWFLVLLHESCHMDQWLGKSSIWSNLYFGGKDVYDMLEEWINGKEFEKWEIEKIIKSCIDIELDCEKRVVEKIMKYKLVDYDRIEYVKKANSYISFYGVILKRRKWYENAPYLQDSVWKAMPIIFLEKGNYFHVKDEMIELYDKYCFD